mmetsp:Transcript_4794/g.10611  ORF Transcript_4794/g.10611 Transcript_4794/m.10611 type:complete len:288 (-) Transcript_4794:706-1569(-)
MIGTMNLLGVIMMRKEWVALLDLLLPMWRELLISHTLSRRVIQRIQMDTTVVSCCVLESKPRCNRSTAQCLDLHHSGAPFSTTLPKSWRREMVCWTSLLLVEMRPLSKLRQSTKTTNSSLEQILISLAFRTWLELLSCEDTCTVSSSTWVSTIALEPLPSRLSTMNTEHRKSRNAWMKRELRVSLLSRMRRRSRPKSTLISLNVSKTRHQTKQKQAKLQKRWWKTIVLVDYLITLITRLTKRRKTSSCVIRVVWQLQRLGMIEIWTVTKKMIRRMIELTRLLVALIE